MHRCMGCMNEIEETIDCCPSCGYAKGTPPKESYHLQPETVLNGRFIVGRVLGYGGFGVTYIGYDAELSRKVAIKEFLPSMFASRMPGDTSVTVYSGENTRLFKEGKSRFMEEAKRLAQFHGVAGIVDIYDIFEENQTAYIVMELLTGQDIKHLIAVNGVLPYETAREIIAEVCNTLKEVHQAGIIHRDISPDNIFITEENVVKLIDFGAARYETSRNSKSLSVILKSGYAPEEQYRSRGVQGSWSDIYALAATFYKMVTGITPQDSMERAIKDDLKEPSELGIPIPEAVENTILNGLAVRCSDRIQTAEEFYRGMYSDHMIRNKVKSKKENEKVPLWSKILIASSISLFLLFALMSATGVIGASPSLLIDNFGSGVKMGYINTPGVMNLSQDEAKKILQESELNFQIVGKEYSDKIEKQKVLSQDPLPGRSIQKLGTVSVVICGGSEADRIITEGEIPDVTLETVEQAYSQFEQVEGATIIRKFKYDSAIKRGLIIFQDNSIGQDGLPVIKITVSLGQAELMQPYTIHGLPYMEVSAKNDQLILEYVKPLKDKDSFQTVFEQKVENQEFKDMDTFEKGELGTENSFSDISSEEEQKIFESDMLMKLAATQTEGNRTYQLRSSVVSETNGVNAETYDYDKKVIIDNRSEQFPTVKVEGIQKLTWSDVNEDEFVVNYKEFGNEEVVPYLIKGDFKKSKNYFIYEGAGNLGKRRNVKCEADGQLIVACKGEYDGKEVLAKILPLYGSGVKEDGTLFLQVGIPTIVDGSTLILKNDVSEIKGKPVMEAVSILEQQVKKNRYRIPYRFSFIYDEQVKRGCVIDYYLEGDSDNGEIYKLDILISNGSKNDCVSDYIVPVQWVPDELTEFGPAEYAELIFLVLPAVGNENSFDRYTYFAISDDDGKTWYHGEEQEQDYTAACLRGDGTNRDAYYSPEGHVKFSWLARGVEAGSSALGNTKMLGRLQNRPNTEGMEDPNSIVFDVPFNNMKE